MPKIAAILRRLREPSTMAGLAAIAVLTGLPPGTVDLVTQIIGGFAGLAAIMIPEGLPDA